MTEDEAKTRWCPFARVQIPGGLVNRVSRAMWRILTSGTPDHAHYKDIEADCNCIGSACMAWRWEGGAFPLPNDPSGIREYYQGYCGLAGKP